MAESRILPAQLVTEVEMFADQQVDRAAKYDNCELFDEGSVFDLHTLAARIYADGFADGSQAEAARNRGARGRKHDAERRATEKETTDER